MINGLTPKEYLDRYSHLLDGSVPAPGPFESIEELEEGGYIISFKSRSIYCTASIAHSILQAQGIESYLVDTRQEL